MVERIELEDGHAIHVGSRGWWCDICRRGEHDKDRDKGWTHDDVWRFAREHAATHTSAEEVK